MKKILAANLNTLELISMLRPTYVRDGPVGESFKGQSQKNFDQWDF